MTHPIRTGARSASAGPNSSKPKTGSFWILGPFPDLLLVIGSPLIVYALITIAQMQWSAAAVSSIVMIWAIGHHLPGMMRAYGDPDLFSRYRLRFILAPLFLVSVCSLSFLYGLHGILVVAGVWGWWHYLMQTYGFARIYDAKAGSFAARTCWLDQTMCFTWFGAAILLNDNALFGFITNFYNSGIPIPSPEFFATSRTLVSVFTASVTAAFLVNWWWNLRAGVRPNPAKALLMASTFAFFWYSTATVTRIVVAYAFFELFHDIQYLTIVWAFNQNRVKKDKSLRGFTRFLFRPRFALIMLYLAAVFAYGSLDYGSKLVSPGTLQQVLFGCFLASALLHFYFDGFIWKLRETKTQSTLELEASAGRRNEFWFFRRLPHGLLWSLFVIAMLGLTYAEISKRGVEANENPAVMRDRLASESRKWADIMPNSFQANFYDGLAFEWQGNYAAAKHRYERALAILPGYDDAIAGLKRLRANKSAPSQANSPDQGER